MGKCTLLKFSEDLQSPTTWDTINASDGTGFVLYSRDLSARCRNGGPKGRILQGKFSVPPLCNRPYSKLSSDPSFAGFKSGSFYQIDSLDPSSPTVPSPSSVLKSDNPIFFSASAAASVSGRRPKTTPTKKIGLTVTYVQSSGANVPVQVHKGKNNQFATANGLCYY